MPSIHLRRSRSLLLTEQRNTTKTHRRWQICISRMGKRFWRTRSLKLRCWGKSPSPAHRVKRKNVGCRSFHPFIPDIRLPTVGPGNGPILEFGDEGEGEEEEEEEDGTVDLLAQSGKEPEEVDEEEEGEDAEPEDDFNAAWEVFELARSIYEKGNDGDDETKLKLADVYIALGDVSLETGAALVLCP